jgi:hypothetical protein
VQGTIGPAFIVGSGLSHADIARQLTAFALAFPAGQLLGAVLVAIAGGVWPSWQVARRVSGCAGWRL